MARSIAVFSDVVCPWCFVGKRRLEAALDRLGIRDTTRVEWLPFELNPDMPEDGMARAEYRARKFGPERGAELDATMTATGRTEGIAFALDRIERTPNTRRAHMALAHALPSGRQAELKEALLRAYFEEGRDVGDPATLLEIGATVGLDRGGLAGALEDKTIRARVVALERKAAEIGVSGVPFFIVDGAFAVSGAQPTETWISVLTRPQEDEAEAPEALSAPR